MVDHVPPLLPPLPDPQALAAREISPLLSACKHLVPEPLKLDAVRAVPNKLPMYPMLALKFVVEAKPETKRDVEVALVIVALVPLNSVLVSVVIVDDAPTTAFAT